MTPPDLAQAQMSSEVFLRLPQVRALTGLSRPTIYRRMALQTFPQQLALTQHMVVWLESEVRAWMTERVARCRGAS